MTLHKDFGAIQLALRAALGACSSFAIAQALQLEYPIFALIAAVIVTDISAAETRKLGAKRMVATAIGATVGLAICMLLTPGLYAAGLSIFLAMLVSNLLNASEGAKSAGFIAGLVLLTHGADPVMYAVHRFVETGLGIAVAWLISLVPRLINIKESATEQDANR